MAEQVDLTVAEAKPSNPSYTLERVTIDVKAKTITVQLLGANGESKSKTYDNATVPTGATLLTNLNKANFSGGNASLVKAIFNRLTADGVITGTVSGAPD